MLAIPPLIVAFIVFAYCIGVEHFEIPRSSTLADGLFDVDLAMIPYVFFVVLFRRDAQKRKVAGGV